MLIELNVKCLSKCGAASGHTKIAMMDTFNKANLANTQICQINCKPILFGCQNSCFEVRFKWHHFDIGAATI